MDRDFKGVWIPKDIWLCKELSALDRVIYAEIDSLDNAGHCMAGNEYFAEFCGVSEATVTRSIQKLIDGGYIERLSFDGRHRVLKVTKLPNQNDEADSAKRLASNIDNNTENKDITINSNISEQTEFDSHMYSPSDFLGSSKKRKRNTTAPKKPTLYDKCKESINLFTTDAILQDMLSKFLQIRLQIKDKPLYGVEQWNALLSKLTELSSDNYVQRDIVKRSIESGWASFYPLKTASCNKSKDVVTSEYGKVHCDKNDSEDSVDEAF